jgi:mono/diheme cytochrome c family protein
VEVDDMIPVRFWIAALSAAWLAMPAWADSGSSDDARALAAKIDRLIAARWASEKVAPAPPTDDGAFLRRLSLDVIGRVPSVAETRRFLRDPTSDKRGQAIERLLDSPGYVTNFSNVWRDLLLPEANADFQQRFLGNSIESWLRKQFTDNVSYDRMVRELLTLPLKMNQRQLFAVYNQNGSEPTPMAFYLAKQGKPENLAASTARLFLGIRLECAQCHNHPSGRWTREQFWGQAAFFGGIKRQGNNGNFSPLNEVADRRELSIPGTERVAQARFLDGKEPRLRYKDSARASLAVWMTAADNPFFARAAVNRLWAHFFGVGIVEPVDDFSDENKPSHPELLDELARQFIKHGFDYRFMIRAITLSKTYQLSSVHPGAPPPDARLFARMPVKGLSQDQLMDSLTLTIGAPSQDPNRRRNFFNPAQTSFQDKFVSQDKRTEYQTSIPQALALMNSQLVADATHPQRSQFLAAVANAPFLDTDGRIETLYLAALSRKPQPDEAEKLRRYVEKGGAAKDPKAALGDVFWALLNSPQFFLNH